MVQEATGTPLILCERPDTHQAQRLRHLSQGSSLFATALERLAAACRACGDFARGTSGSHFSSSRAVSRVVWIHSAALADRVDYRGDAARQELLRDIESYCSGEMPSPLTLMRVPTMEEWSVEIRRRGKAFGMMICGDVYRLPEIVDGTWISTPALVWFDRNRRFVRTHSRVFALGKPQDQKIPIDGVAW